jgi:hypothetical protein
MEASTTDKGGRPRIYDAARAEGKKLLEVDPKMSAKDLAERLSSPALDVPMRIAYEIKRNFENQGKS